jgi:hypothetical protein
MRLARRRALKTRKVEPLEIGGPMARGLHRGGAQEVVTMVPSTIVIPAMPQAMLAGVFHPVGLFGILAALVVVVAVGLCAAIAGQGGTSVDRARRQRVASIRGVRLAGRGNEREGAAAA